MEAGIRTELDELQLKLVFSVYRIKMRLGTFNRDMLNWIKPILERYAGAHQTASVVQMLDLMASLDETQLAAHVATQASQAQGLALKKYSAPYLDAKAPDLGMFPENLQRSLLSIKAHLELFNQEIDLARHYTGLTFDSSLDVRNREIVLDNVTQRYVYAAEAAQTIAELIETLELREETDIETAVSFREMV